MSNRTERFLWGAATSAFQIEGHITNDMTDWETLGKFKQNGNNPFYNNAANHWLTWEKDFEILKELNVNAYRFSIEWARIEPKPGSYNKQAVKQYSAMIDRLIELNIEPVLTLHHFTHPVWFHRKSPWHKKESVERYVRYVSYILPYLEGRVRYFITFNEPLVWALAAYADAKFPPGKKSFDLMMQALYHLLQAHGKVYDIIKSRNDRAEVGVAKNFIVFKPFYIWNPADFAIASIAHNFFNMMILNAFEKNQLSFRLPFVLNFEKTIDLKDKIDFWGVNYYYRTFTRFKFDVNAPMQLEFKHKSGEGLSEMGWENYSPGLLKAVKWAASTGKTVFVTENGLATEDDKKRISYLRNHLNSVHKALDSGLNLKGYFYWSFLDNYEWLIGTKARFGLVGVDYTQEYRRTLRDSGRFYAEFIRNIQTKNI